MRFIFCWQTLLFQFFGSLNPSTIHTINLVITQKTRNVPKVQAAQKRYINIMSPVVVVAEVFMFKKQRNSTANDKNIEIVSNNLLTPFGNCLILFIIYL